jgi:alpha-L-rhamnosidase
VDPAQPGYRQIILRPRPGGGLTRVRAALHTLYGSVESAWRLDDGRFEWEVTVPPNAIATAHVPASEGATITEGDSAAESADGVMLLHRDADETVYRLASGRYRFAVRAR